MLDLKFILKNIDEVRDNCIKRNVTVDLEQLQNLAQARLEMLLEVEEIRKEQNEIAKEMKKPISQELRTQLIAEGTQRKEKVAQKEDMLRSIDAQVKEIQEKIPNMTHPDVPVGKGEQDSKEIKVWGEKPNFNFPPKDHVQLGKNLNILDFEGGTKVSGQKFYFLKRDGVLLEQALINFALKMLMEEGFELHTTPDLAKSSILYGTGFTPRGEETQIYSIENTDLCLIATAEITLAGKYAQEILDKADLPLKLAGYSHCFRTEAGAHGKASKGLYRVHQFSKVEMFVYTTPEDSENMLKKLVEIEEKIFQKLEIPYRVIECSSGDLGGPAYRKYDLEAWMPGRDEQGSYGEVTSASNCSDYQARRLAIRYKEKGMKGTNLVHTLNGTAIAISRAIIAILENHQQADGTVKIPAVLQNFMGKEILGA